MIASATTVFFAMALETVTSFGSNPGNLAMYRHVPAGVGPNAPVVLVLHGCSQAAADIAQIGWNELADRWKFYVVYPEQKSANNSLRCFNWAGEYGDPTNLRRGQGENLSIKQMVDQMKADYSIDANRVFITGFSGGAAQATLMLAVWPDVFAAGAPVAGIPYNCTTAFAEVSGCLNPGKDKTPAQWGDLARAAHLPAYTGRWPRVQIWQGTSDSLVNPINQREILEQFTNLHGIDAVADATTTAGKLTRAEYRDAGGVVRVETVAVQNMDHGVALDPANGCGTAGSYRLAVGECSTEHIARFFGLAPAGEPGSYDADAMLPIVGDAGAGEPPGDGGAGGGGSGGGGGGGGGGGSDGGTKPKTPVCGCSATGPGETGATAVAIGLALLVAHAARRRRRR